MPNRHCKMLQVCVAKLVLIVTSVTWLIKVGGGGVKVGSHPRVLLTYLLTYLLTAWNGVLLEKLTGSQLVKKFQPSYRPRRFIAAFSSARHFSTFSARSVLSMYPSPLRSHFLKISSYQMISPGPSHIHFCRNKARF